MTDADLLRAWEQGRSAGPVARGLLLLAAAFPGRDPDELAALPVGRRDGLLLDLREQVFGPHVEALVDCPACGTRLEVECTTADLRAPDAAADFPAVTAAGVALRFRLPTSLDLLAAAAAGSVERARRALFERCVIPPDGLAAADLPAEAVGAVGRALADADPQAALALDVDCPGCGAAAAVPCDMVQFFWRELHAWAARTFREVHTLATAYGWPEDAILALSPRRRRTYLDLVTG